MSISFYTEVISDHEINSCPFHVTSRFYESVFERKNWFGILETFKETSESHYQMKEIYFWYCERNDSTYLFAKVNASNTGCFSVLEVTSTRISWQSFCRFESFRCIHMWCSGRTHYKNIFEEKFKSISFIQYLHWGRNFGICRGVSMNQPIFM